MPGLGTFDALPIKSDGSVSAMDYDAAGNLVATTDANGNQSRFEYNAAGRRTRVTDAMGGEMVYVKGSSPLLT